MISMQRSASAISLEYPREPDMTRTNDGFDTEISKMFGSLSLKAWAPEAVAQVPTPPQQNVQLVDDSVMMEVIDSAGSLQTRTNTACYPDFQLYEPTTPQLIEAGPSTPPPAKKEEPETPGCAMMHLLQARYLPSEAQHVCSSQSWDKDFNLLDTILTHRDAFLACPVVHRQCSIALTRIAFALEHRYNDAQPYADIRGNEADLDVAIALHNEAWLMSGWYST